MRKLFFKRRNAKLIQKIHNSFYSEVDQLLLYAKNKIEINDDQENELKEKADRLKKHGFVSTKEVKIIEDKRLKRTEIKRENEKKDELIKAIDYFSKKYPAYKFITFDSINKLCKQYNLEFNSVEYYIGDVPEQNLQQIENFKIDEEDLCYVETYTNVLNVSSHYKNISHSKYLTELSCRNSTNNEIHPILGIYFSYDIAPLEIVAPATDFYSLHYYSSKKTNTVQDPIVLRSVLYNDNKYYLIVTAWGD